MRATAGLVPLFLILTPALQAQDEPSSRHFATCAAYYFLNSHVSQMTDYERLYQSGERALNAATLRSDPRAAQADFDRASNDMMELMGRDWLNFGRVEAKFGRPCEELMGREAIYLRE